MTFGTLKVLLMFILTNLPPKKRITLVLRRRFNLRPRKVGPFLFSHLLVLAKTSTPHAFPHPPTRVNKSRAKTHKSNDANPTAQNPSSNRTNDALHLYNNIILHPPPRNPLASFQKPNKTEKNKPRVPSEAQNPPLKMAIIFSIKTLLLSTAALSAALLFSLSLPIVRHFLTSVVPQIWSSLLSWLTPPYLYFVINGIIISIVASSKFQQQQQEASLEELPEKSSVEVQPDFEIPAVVLKSPAEIRPDFEVNREVVYGEMEKVTGKEEEEEFVISRSDWKPRRRDSMEYSMVSKEKPLVSVRIGHRKSVKASPEGKNF